MYKNLAILFLVSICVSLILFKLFIPILKKIKCKQEILSYVKEHSLKNGTPTMGGLLFIMPSLIIGLFVCDKQNNLTIFTIAIVFAYMVVGFLDDFIKIKNKENQGLRAYQKIIFQFAIAIFVAIYCFRNSLTIIYLPFINKQINVDWWIIPLVIIVFLATTNTVNLTDGLDGLAGKTSFVYVLFIAILILLQMQNNSRVYLIKEEYINLIKLASILCGAILGFLAFNTNKASVFMGDTGSLAIGGFIASLSIFSGNMLYIPIMGVCFVFSGLSVIIQVLYYKITKGKRVFLMAPIHHHFQKKGYSENKIGYAYFLITLIISVCCVLNYL